MCQKVGLNFGLVYEDRTLQSIVNQGFSNKIDLARGDMVYMEENYFKRDNYFKLNEKPVLLNFGPITLKTNEEWVDVISAIETEINFFPLSYHPQYYDLTTTVDYTPIYKYEKMLTRSMVFISLWNAVFFVY